MCRELTKRHETVYQSVLSEAAAYYEQNAPKGECVLVIEGLNRQELVRQEQERWADMSIEEHMEHYLSRGMDRKEAMKQTAKDRGVPKEKYIIILRNKKVDKNTIKINDNGYQMII